MSGDLSLNDFTDAVEAGIAIAVRDPNGEIRYLAAEFCQEHEDGYFVPSAGGMVWREAVPLDELRASNAALLRQQNADLN